MVEYSEQKWKIESDFSRKEKPSIKECGKMWTREEQISIELKFKKAGAGNGFYAWGWKNSVCPNSSSRNSIYMNNVHPHGQWTMRTSDTQNCCANANEEFPITGKTTAMYLMKIAHLRWCTHVTISSGNINGRWAASKRGAPGNHGLRWQAAQRNKNCWLITRSRSD